jgi:hypothetical protein
MSEPNHLHDRAFCPARSSAFGPHRTFLAPLTTTARSTPASYADCVRGVSVLAKGLARLDPMSTNVP